MDAVRKNILKEVTSGSYIVSFVVVFFIYLGINVYVNQLYVTGLGIFSMYRTFFAIPFIFFLFLVPGLVALNVNLVVYKFKDLKLMSKRGRAGAGSVGFLGISAGLIGGACPGCFAGLFPAAVGIFGVTATLSSLPFNGLEVQLASSVLLFVSIYFLTRPVSCEIDFSKE
tara:strand:- start:1679 stop:2188 length:510 start_codon:yes stop_codon:yes gene_type:complete